MDEVDIRKVQLAVANLLTLILSIAIHEFGHAYVADRLGDGLPRRQGRVTLNPLAHIDPIGTILFPLLGFFTGLPFLGWGKPVMTSPRAGWLIKMREKTANLLISVAGPLMNIGLAGLMSVVFLVLTRLGFRESDRVREVPLLLYYVGRAIELNIGLALFNMIPCPPLDGRSVLFFFLPHGHPVERFLVQYGSLIFFALLLTGLFRIILVPVGIVTNLWLDLLLSWAP
ncbi:MAG: site-2 protease family protein [Myxococcales bacterium]|nr:site-2 protease family protein [Myxococcales bacterium]